jgi:ketosteroid isomerase-like protein
MTRTHSTADTVGEIYQAFGRGDIHGILAGLADDVAWEVWPDNSAQRAGVAHLQARRGPQEVEKFFAVIAGWSVNDFRVLDVIGAGRQVVAQISVDFTLPGGARLVDEELHLWTFDDAGRVVAFRHYCDTAKHISVTQT